MNIWGAGGGASNYFNQGSLYGGNQNMWGAPIISGPGQSAMNQNPQAAYMRWTSPFAGGQDAFSRFTQDQFGNVNRGFQAAQMTNPDLRFDNYYNGLGGLDFFRRQFNQLSARDRGLSPANYGAGGFRWFPAI